jgi:hypothetical protein
MISQPPSPPACGHDAASFGPPLCTHLRTCRQPWLRYVKRYVGSGLDLELLCVPCADQREAGAAPAVGFVCRACCEYAITEVGEVAGIRGQPEVRVRAESFDAILETTPLPPELGPTVDLAPVDRGPGSAWLLLTERGQLARFDAHTQQWSVAGAATVPAENREPWCDRICRRRLHVSAGGEFAAIVNDYGRHGEVIDLGTGRTTMILDGGDSDPETVPFSLSFVEHRGRVLVIHRTDWNRLDVSDAATAQLLTARKRVGPGSPQPDPEHDLDYFHGALAVNPAGTRIVDDGWIWHPVGVPVTWSLGRWLLENPWESEDGPTKLDLCARDSYWDHAIAWLDDDRVAVAGIGDAEDELIDGARIFDVTSRSPAGLHWNPHVPWARELTAFPGPAGRFFGEGGWLFSSHESGLSRWDPTTGERTGHLAGFQPTHLHRGARELAQLRDGALVRLVLDRGASRPSRP